MSNFLAAGLLILAIASPTIAGDDKEAPFKITTQRDNDRVEMKVDKGRAIFSVHSPFGISQAVIERTDAHWPSAVVLRLHFKGLENLRASNGKVRLEVSVSHQEGKTLVRLWKDGKEDTPLESKSPYWMEIRILGSDGKATTEIPLMGGYFEMELPMAFFEGNPKSITVNWIDFYRN